MITEAERVRMTVSVSRARKLSPEDLEKWGINFLKFVAPTLAVFFAQLSLNVPWKLAIPIALLALYQSLSDLFGKYKSETITK